MVGCDWTSHLGVQRLERLSRNRKVQVQVSYLPWQLLQHAIRLALHLLESACEILEVSLAILSTSYQYLAQRSQPDIPAALL